MKVLHYSDRAAENFEELYNQCDVLVTTGDLTLFDFGSLINTPPSKPAFGVYGNHDSGQYLERLGISNLHANTIQSNGLLWGGLQGCLKYKNSDLMYTEDEARNWANSFPPVDILLLHAGPLGLLDDPSDDVHRGSPAIRAYVDQNRPRFVFVGHQYSDDTMEWNGTTLFRTYGARIIEIAL